MVCCVYFVGPVVSIMDLESPGSGDFTLIFKLAFNPLSHHWRFWGFGEVEMGALLQYW